MEYKKFSFIDRLKSFKYAFNGLKILFKNEHNARIHLLAAICVVILGVVFQISSYAWIAVALAIGLVFITEIINSAIEYLADFVSPTYHELIKKVKDLAAAAVLVAAITALIIGLLVFVPEILAQFN